jgi:hypothetical protein
LLVSVAFCYDIPTVVLINLAGYYLPSIFAAKNGELGLSIETTYRNYLAIYTPGIVAVVLGSMMYKVPVFGSQQSACQHWPQHDGIVSFDRSRSPM